MVQAIVNVGGEHPVEVDLHPPAAGEPAFIGIYPRMAWTDDPAKAGIAHVNKATGERYMLEQHLVPISALVDAFLISPFSVDANEREALAQVFDECANKLRLAVVSDVDTTSKQ